MGAAVAVVCGNHELTYSQLNRRANQVAHKLLSRGIQPDDLVAVCVDRGLQSIIGLDLQPHRDLLIPLCAALFVAACLVHDWRRHRVAHPVYVIGGLVIIASWPLRNMIGHSEWYFPIGEQVARLAHSMFES